MGDPASSWVSHLTTCSEWVFGDKKQVKGIQLEHDVLAGAVMYHKDPAGAGVRIHG